MPPETETPDPVAAYLAEVYRELDAAAPWGSFGAEDFDWARHVPRLLGAVEAVLGFADHAEHGALRWADPLPVPDWVPEIREIVRARLLGKENGDA